MEKLLRDPSIRKVFELLNADGEEGRIAGGAVRDSLLGRIPAEIDFATSAVPDDVMARASGAGLKVVPTGIAHGTVTLIVAGRPFEVTTLRRDVETDGRHAVVAFGRDWAEDAKRRDFTINGLFLDRNGHVHDHVGGRDDLAAGRVRFIGDARSRIREDFLRILRFFRFHSGYAEGSPDKAALSAAIAERHGLETLSRERIRAEMLKLLATGHAAETAKLMSDSGLFGFVLGGIVRSRRLAKIAKIEAALESAPDPILRLGALALFVRDNAERLHEKLRLSNGEAARVLNMAEPRAELSPYLHKQEQRALLYRLGAQTFRDHVLLRWAESGAEASDSGWLSLVELPGNWAIPTFPVSGGDLLALGVPKGPKVGAMLRALEERWIAAGFPDADWMKEELAKLPAAK